MQNELRIGNWVYDSKYTQYPMQVVCVGSDYVYLDFEGNEGDVWEALNKTYNNDNRTIQHKEN